MKYKDINDAFQMLIDEFTTSIKIIKDDKKNLIDEDRIEESDKLSEKIKKVCDLKDKILAIKNEFLKDFSDSLEKPHSPNAPTQTKLKVYINGRIIYNTNSSKTFAEAIEELGVDDVFSVGWKCSEFYLLSEDEYSNYGGKKRKHMAGRYYVFNSINNQQKKTVLESISHKLNKKIKVEIMVL
jgi:hypothetical protein